jgi:hypothetical protein
VNLESVRQNKIDPNERDHCTPCKASEEDRFCEVAASPNSPNLTERGISKAMHFCSLFRNNLKNWKFGEGLPHNSCLERATIVRAQGASEDKKCEEQPTLPKANSAGCFGLIAILLLFLSGCVNSAYHPSYIISDKSHEEKSDASEGSR